MELSRCKLKKFLIIFRKKKILIFREMELSSPKLKTLIFFPKNNCLYFRRELEKPGKQNVSPKISKFNFLHQNFLFQKKFRGCQ